MAEIKPAANPQRPLSPHLQIYRPMLSMTMSIAHRATGIALYGGSILLVWWFAAAAQSDSYFDLVQAFFNHWFGRIVLFGFTLALMQHMLGGIRHLIWDTGALMEKHMATKLALGNFAGGLVLTILAWAAAYMVRGGL